jgi:adenosylcobinamide-GDP ribazoletransferase
MKKEVRIFFTALMYFTRIRVPKSIDHSLAYLQKAPKYFPLVGWIVGAGCSLAFLLFAGFISVDIGILASMITGLLLTGAFHEDGFADVCDGFGGGWTKEKILLIMKDSRIGAFGAIGLIAIFASKFLLLTELSRRSQAVILIPKGNSFTNTWGPVGALFSQYHYFVLFTIAAHSLSRLMPVLLIQWSTNVTDADHSKSRPVTGSRLTPGELLLAVFLAVLPFVLLSWQYLLSILPVLLTTYALSRYFKKWIGGYTGDCLGAIQQVTEIVFYLTVILMLRLLTIHY